MDLHSHERQLRLAIIHADFSPLESIGRGIALCPEDRKAEGLVGGLTVRENIILALQANQGYFKYLRRRTWSLFQGLELTVTASIVTGGTVLTGGVGYILGTMFGVLLLVVTQTLIQDTGQLSSWWTNIVVGVTLCMIVLTISGFSFLFSGTTAVACEAKPFRQDQAALLMQDGAVIT